jgi:hypothetical protein
MSLKLNTDELGIGVIVAGKLVPTYSFLRKTYVLCLPGEGFAVRFFIPKSDGNQPEKCYGISGRVNGRPVFTNETGPSTRFGSHWFLDRTTDDPTECDLPGYYEGDDLLRRFEFKCFGSSGKTGISVGLQDQREVIHAGVLEFDFYEAVVSNDGSTETTAPPKLGKFIAEFKIICATAEWLRRAGLVDPPLPRV